MKKAFVLAWGIIALVTFALWAVNVSAYPRYKDPATGAGNCSTCHGNFTDGTSPKGTVFPSDNKHTMHRSTSYMGTDCALCHTSGDGRNPFIGSSDGTAVNPGVGCVGCHGRFYSEPVGYSGVGLRAHHLINGITMCSSCHPGDPEALGEHVQPVYYDSADTNAADTCNSTGLENWSIGDTLGLDNDGDNLYDGSDPDCGAPVCGDGVIDPGEDCDDGTANGTTECGCQLNCTYTEAGSACGDPSSTECDNPDTCDGMGICEPNYEPPGTACDDGLYCSDGEACNGSGVCTGGVPRDCSDGISCTDDSCDETSDACVNMPNDTNCPDDGLFCTGTEFCDPAADCSSTGDPCDPATETCNEETDACDPVTVVIDLDIARFSVTKNVRLANPKAVKIKLVVRNGGEFNSQSRPATVVAMQNGVQVYSETMAVSDEVGNGRNTYLFPAYSPGSLGEIMWTATIADDDPDEDTAIATTSVK